jgi:hypothetical protein
MLLNLAGEWWDWSVVWQLPIGIVSFACAIMMVAEGQVRTDGHVTLNLHH